MARFFSSKLARVLFVVAALFLALALLSPGWSKQSEIAEAHVVVDISESVDSGVGEELLKRAYELTAGARRTTIYFGERTGAVSEDTRGYLALRRAHEGVNVGKSSLEAGLSATAAHHTPLFLVSDGWENVGSVERILPLLKSAQVQVYPIVPSEQSAERGIFAVTTLTAPLVAPAAKSVRITTVIKNTTPNLQRGQLTILHGDKELTTSKVTVEPGKELLIEVQSDPSAEGIKEITAQLVPEDELYRRTEQRIFLSGEKRERVLLTSGSADDARFLPTILEQQAYELTVRAPETLRESDLATYSTVILNNVSHNRLYSGVSEALDRFVRNGGGLLMIGGDQSFGLGGYIGSPLEKSIPLTMLPPRTEEKRLNIALQLVLDKSLSMAEGNKLEYAKEAAREVVRNLNDEDYVGIIGFDDIPWVVVKLGQLSAVRSAALEKIGRLYPVRKTNLLPAIDEARRTLITAPAGRKHMIILTDGKVPDGGPFYLELTKEMRREGITVSTVMMGGESDVAMLRDMAEIGGGAFYQTLDARSLPKIFLSDVKTRSGEKTLKEQREYRVREGPDGIRSTTLTDFPPIRGYVQTKRKTGAKLELVASGANEAEPLLASWNVGQGKVAALTTDLNGRWSNAWVAWSRFDTFVTELVDALRTEDTSGNAVEFGLRHTVQGDALMLNLTIYDEQAARDVEGVLKGPDGKERNVTFRSERRGDFMAVVPQALPGTYYFTGMAAGRKLTPVAFYLSGELFGEHQGRGVNTPLLSRIASETGGRINPNLDDIVRATRPEVEISDLSPYALSLAALFFLGAIVVRERRVSLAKLFRVTR
jgi:Ca-activated chloride channel family protein